MRRAKQTHKEMLKDLKPECKRVNATFRAGVVFENRNQRKAQYHHQEQCSVKEGYEQEGITQKKNNKERDKKMDQGWFKCRGQTVYCYPCGFNLPMESCHLTHYKDMLMGEGRAQMLNPLAEPCVQFPSKGLTEVCTKTEENGDNGAGKEKEYKTLKGTGITTETPDETTKCNNVHDSLSHDGDNDEDKEVSNVSNGNIGKENGNKIIGDGNGTNVTEENEGNNNKEEPMTDKDTNLKTMQDEHDVIDIDVSNGFVEDDIIVDSIETENSGSNYESSQYNEYD